MHDNQKGIHIIPTIVFPDGTILITPSKAELVKKLGLKTQVQRQFFDAIVVERIDNYPRFDGGIPDAKFGDRLVRKACLFGVEILQANEAIDVFPQGPSLFATSTDGVE